tara:strand:+ start:225 stop:512 length:288 start_codon:yes stop_codon:yes gene_type:complete
MSAMGMGPFNNNDGLKSVTDAVKNVLSQGKPQVDLPDTITSQHISDAADDVRQNAVTLSDKNRIITQHMQKITGAETTHGNVAAFANEVQRNLNR